MPQLRDATTSEIVAAGSVADLLLIADELGDAVLWDDVPYDAQADRIAVDFAAVREHAEAQLDLLDSDGRKAEISRRRDIVRRVRDVQAVAKSARANSATLPHVEIG